MTAAAAACDGASSATTDTGPPAADATPRGAPFVGIEVCAECHADRAASFRANAHYRTSAAADRTSVHGSFDPPGNRLDTSGAALRFEMEERDGRLWQTAIGAAAGGRTSRPFDISVGSGKLGQSYLYWLRGRLFQLPVSFVAEHARWVNSPGEMYRDGSAEFHRPIVPRCIECHTTWIEHVPGTFNEYVPGSEMYGVTCERCHGPGGEHAAWHRAHPESREPHAIVQPAELPRDRSLDVCGQCHGGVGEPLRPAFSFRPGDVLAEFVAPPPPPKPGAEGLHSSNQLPRLRLSRCFEESGTLTCATCHDPHVHERGDTARFSKRCQGCHAPADCGRADALGPEIADDCIDCHMPALDDAGTTMDLGGELLRPRIREHRIGIYAPR